MSNNTTVAQIILEHCHLWGVKNIYGVADALEQAFIQATTLRGVAHISVPKNISQIDQAILSLRASHKPMMLIGEGSRMVGAEVVQLAETLQAGIIETLGAKGTITYDHPLLIGGIGNGGTTESQQLLHEADCVLVVGANYWPEDFVPQQTQIIQIDISPTNKSDDLKSIRA